MADNLQSYGGAEPPLKTIMQAGYLSEVKMEGKCHLIDPCSF